MYKLVHYLNKHIPKNEIKAREQPYTKDTVSKNELKKKKEWKELFCPSIRGQAYYHKIKASMKDIPLKQRKEL